MAKTRIVTIRVSYLVKVEATSKDVALEWLDNQRILTNEIARNYVGDTLAFDLWGEKEGEEYDES